MSTWAEQWRADRVTAREQDRADRAQAAELARVDRAERAAARERARVGQAERAAARRVWLAGHVVELLIYPLALVSAVMAVPAMAAYGHDLYDGPTGYVLPVLSELGMWAFAMAVHLSRRRDPDRPTGMLTAGIVVFAAVGAGLNFAHGLEQGVLTGLVMAVVSVAGVVAHQLAVAAPPRSRAERAGRQIVRQEARRVARARRIAARRAVVELAADGSATLVYAPGRYVPHRGRLAPADPAPPPAPPAPERSEGVPDAVVPAQREPGPTDPTARRVAELLPVALEVSREISATAPPSGRQLVKALRDREHRVPNALVQPLTDAVAAQWAEVTS